MKVLCFIDNLGAGGAQRQIVGLTSLLKENGVDAKICIYYHENFYENELIKNHIEVAVIPHSKPKLSRIFWSWVFFCREKPDWIIAFQETPSLIACTTKLINKRFHLLVSERNTTQSLRAYDRIRFSLYRLADSIVPNSYSQAEWLVEHYPWMASKLTTITNFVDLNHFCFVEHNKKSIPTILVVATICASKNTTGLITAAKIMRERGLLFTIKWYGFSPRWQDYFNHCKALIELYHLDSFFFLYEKIPDIVSAYRDADYFCLPSFYEGTPNAICEAIASGLPVICSDICDNHHYVNESNGVRFNPRDPNDIANKMGSYITQNDSDYLSAREASRNIAEGKLSENTFIEKYRTILGF